MSLLLDLKKFDYQAVARYKEQLSCDKEIILLCATSAQEGDVGRALSLGAVSDCVPGGEGGNCNGVSVRPQSMGAFIASLWNRWGNSHRLIGDALRLKTIESILDNCQIPKSFQTPGGKSLLAYLVSNYSPSSRLRETVKISSQHMHEIELLIDTYFERIELEGYIEQSFAIGYLIKDLKAGTAQIGASTMLVFGFSDFTQPQLDLLRACAEQLEVRIYLDWNKGNPGIEHMQNTVDTFLSIGAIMVEDADICAVQDRAFDVSCDVILGKAQGLEAEIALLASVAKEEHDKAPFSRKALVLPNINTHLRALVRNLQAKDVPYELDVVIDFHATGLGATIIALLRCCLEDNPIENGRAFASSGYSGLTNEEALDYDTRWRRHRASGRKILTQLSGEGSAISKELGLIRGSSMTARVGDWANLITKLYETGSRFADRSLFDEEQDAAVQKAAVMALQELYEEALLQRDEPDGGYQNNNQPGRRILDFDPYLSAKDLLSSLRGIRIKQTPAAASTAVLIAQPSRIYGRAFDVVIAGGLSSQADLQKGDSPLGKVISSQLAGAELTDAGAEQLFNEGSIFGAAQNRLYLIAQHQTLGGQEIEPGTILNLLQRSMGEDFYNLPFLEMSFDQALVGSVTSGLVCEEKMGSFLQGETALSQLKFPARANKTTFDLGYNDDTVVSVSTLQDYANCPYYWFLHRFSASKEVDVSFDARTQGKFAHQVLRKFYEQLQSRKIANRITEENLTVGLNLYHEIFEEEAQKLEREISLQPEELPDLVRLRQALEAFLKTEPNYAPEFIPRYFEYEFGNGGQKEHSESCQKVSHKEPIDIGIGLPLRGVIDRIDVRDDGAALIIGYKRKGDGRGITAQANHNQFQGVFYRLAARKALPVHPVSHSYRSYDDPGERQVEAYLQGDNPATRPLGLPKIGRAKIWGLSDKEYDEAVEKMIDAARVATERLREGDIARRRDKGVSVCKYCMYTACEFNQKRTAG